MWSMINDKHMPTFERYFNEWLNVYRKKSIVHCGINWEDTYFSKKRANTTKTLPYHLFRKTN